MRATATHLRKKLMNLIGNDVWKLSLRPWSRFDAHTRTFHFRRGMFETVLSIEVLRASGFGA